MGILFVLLLLISCFFIWSVSQESLFSSHNSSSKYVFLQIEKKNLPERLQLIAHWYAKCLISERVLVVSWLLTDTCNVSLSSIFREFPHNMKVMMDPLPVEKRGSAFLQSVSQAEGLSYILLDDPLHSLSDLVGKPEEIEREILVDSMVNIIHTTDKHAPMSLTEPCIYKNAMLSDFYSQLRVNNDILRRADRIFKYFNNNMLIGVRIDSIRNENGILSFSNRDYFMPYFRLILYFWRYFSHTVEKDVFSKVISEQSISKDEVQRLLGPNVELENNTAGFVLKHVQSEKIKELQCWAHFLITSDRRDIVSQFISQLSALPEWNLSQQQSYKLVYMSSDAQGRTVISVNQVTVTSKVINPLAILADEDSSSHNEHEQFSSPEREMVRMAEWILMSRSSMIIASAGSVFAKAVALSQGFAPSAYPIHFQTENAAAESEVLSWVKMAATMRSTPIIHVFPVLNAFPTFMSNLTFFEDSNQPFCGDYLSQLSESSQDEFQNLYEPCHPQSVPWNIEPAEHHMYCLKDHQ